MATLDQIRQKLKDKENGSSNAPTDNAIYPFWNMSENQTARLRFLPDGDDNNDFFWVERLMIKLPFSGIKGDTDSKPTMVQVPCVEMYGESCPILTEVRKWFKDDDLKELGRKYWKKRSYIFQGFVREDPLNEENPPENPIRRFIIGPQIFNIIKESLMDPEMEELPTDYTSGTDFRINKTTKGQYADYSTSNWSRKETPLTDEEQEAVNKFDLFVLSDYLPKKPGEEELQAIQEMFEASVNGEPYDPDRWSQYYKPAGMQANTGDPNKEQTSVKKPEPNKEETKEDTETSKEEVKEESAEPEPEPENKQEETESESEEESSGNNEESQEEAVTDPKDILAQIRKRQNS